MRILGVWEGKKKVQCGLAVWVAYALSVTSIDRFYNMLDVPVVLGWGWEILMGVLFPLIEGLSTPVKNMENPGKWI